MKHWKKNALITAGGLLAAGVVLCGVGMAMGAKSIEYHDGEWSIGNQSMGFFTDWNHSSAILSVGKTQKAELEETSIHSISVDESIDSDLTIKPGDKWSISYTLSMPERFHYQIDDGELQLHYDRPSNTGTNKKENITVFVPKGVKLDELDLSSSMGDVLLEDLNCTTIDTESSMGDVILHNVTVEELEVDGSMGDVTSTNLTVNQKISVDGSMGDVVLDGTFLCDVDITGGMGDTKLTIRGTNQNDYNYNLDCSMGEIHIDGIKTESGFMGDSLVQDNGQNKEIFIDNGMGDIRIEFKH